MRLEGKIAIVIGAGQGLDVLVKVGNSGGRAGREVVQLYLEGPNADPGHPVRVLAAFASVGAEPGERVNARLTIAARAFQRFDEGVGRWVAEPGAYTIRVGRSSRDLRLSTKVVLR